MDTEDPKEKKRERNKINYLQNKPELSSRARMRYHEKKFNQPDQLIIPFPIRTQTPNNKRTKHRQRLPTVKFLNSILEPFLFVSLIVVSTYFLMRETVHFLSATDTTGAAWLKAMLGEGMVIALSWVRIQGIKMQIWRAVLLIALFCYNGWAIVGGVWTQGVQKTITASVVRQEVAELEAEIAKKEMLRVKYSDRDMISLSRKYEREIATLRNDLNLARAEMLKNSAESLKINFFSFAFFRLLVMLANSFLVTYFSDFSSCWRIHFSLLIFQTFSDRDPLQSYVLCMAEKF